MSTIAHRQSSNDARRWLRAVARVADTYDEQSHARAIAAAEIVGRLVALSRTPINDGAV